MTEAAREAARLRSAAWRAADPARARASVTAARPPGYMTTYLAGYYERHKEAIKARIRARERLLGGALKPINAAKTMRRIARKKQATPSWADDAVIDAFYKEAARLTVETGVAHEVDHLVPLQSKRVCGLHVEHNLTVITSVANKSKGNRWWPDQ